MTWHRRTKTATVEAFVKSEKAATECIGRIIRGKQSIWQWQEKTKDCVGPKNVEIVSYKSEIVHSFTYPVSEVNCKNNISAEIRKRILSANRCVQGFRKHLKSQLTQRRTKVLKYKVLVRPMLIYAVSYTHLDVYKRQPESWLFWNYHLTPFS